ncbi:MAG TPA: Npun_F5749 family FMN-dependent PPOX-type flavoprotein [Trichocoleus sp.]
MGSILFGALSFGFYRWMVFMALAPWRSKLTGVLHRNRSLVYARYLQLATVRLDGRPANRTLVFRDFWGETNQLKFITDDRSEKIDQIDQQPWAEACWYFPKTREQFRLLGSLKLVRADDPDPVLLEARRIQWQALSAAARIQFVWADPRQPRAEASAFDPPPPDAIEPTANFCLLLLDPSQVDHLELRGEPQTRTLYTRRSSPTEQSEWVIQNVNP